MRFDASLPAYAGTRAGHLLLRRLTGFGLKRPPYRAHTNLVFLGELGDCRPKSVTIGNDPLLTGIKSLGAPKFLENLRSGRLGAWSDHRLNHCRLHGAGHQA
jgi:hypothetical protein